MAKESIDERPPRLDLAGARENTVSETVNKVESRVAPERSIKGATRWLRDLGPEKVVFQTVNPDIEYRRGPAKMTGRVDGRAV